MDAGTPVQRGGNAERMVQVLRQRQGLLAALKRLAKTYPMLDKSEMLGATSDMVATHVMQGTDPAQVIDQLEAIFADHYRKLLQGEGR